MAGLQKMRAGGRRNGNLIGEYECADAATFQLRPFPGFFFFFFLSLISIILINLLYLIFQSIYLHLARNCTVLNPTEILQISELIS